MSFVERPIARAELYTADEAFFTGTAAEVAPILSIDRKPIRDGNPGEVTCKLRDEYNRVVTGLNEKYLQYLTHVYGAQPYVQISATVEEPRKLARGADPLD